MMDTGRNDMPSDAITDAHTHTHVPKLLHAHTPMHHIGSKTCWRLSEERGAEKFRSSCRATSLVTRKNACGAA